MTDNAFEWKLSEVTPALLQALGAVTLWWPFVDSGISGCLSTFASRADFPKRIPRDTSRRIKLLDTFARELYLEKLKEPEEYRVFAWFRHRLADANGRRSGVAHGILGSVKKRGKSYKGLKIEFPSEQVTFTQMSVLGVERLAIDLQGLAAEVGSVSLALYEAVICCHPQHELWDSRSGSWAKVDISTRNLLPHSIPIPPSFAVPAMLNSKGEGGRGEKEKP